MDSRNPAPTVRHCGRSSELDVARADDEPLLFEGTPAPGLAIAAPQLDVMPILGPRPVELKRAMMPPTSGTANRAGPEPAHAGCRCTPGTSSCLLLLTRFWARANRCCQGQRPYWLFGIAYRCTPAPVLEQAKGLVAQAATTYDLPLWVVGSLPVPPYPGQDARSFWSLSLKGSGRTRAFATAVMKLVSPAQRGRTWRWKWPGTPAPAARPRLAPMFSPSGL
jgi:hypothetical protein